MSGWTEYVIAKVSDAKELANENNPKSRWPGFEGYKFFGPSLLAPLFRILGNETATYQDFRDLGLGTCGWVYELPSAMVVLLAKLNKEITTNIAEEWSKRLAEMSENYSRADIEALLRKLCALAERASEANEPVLLWQSTTC